MNTTGGTDPTPAPNIAGRLAVLSQINETNAQIDQQFNQLLTSFKWTTKDLQRNHHRSTVPLSLRRTRRKPQPCPGDASPDLRSSTQKLADYEQAIRQQPPENIALHCDILAELRQENATDGTNGDGNQTLAEIMREKRNLKRRRQKYRTTKAPPLSYTEEVRQLIALQNEAWTQFNEQKRKSSSSSKRRRQERSKRKD